MWRTAIHAPRRLGPIPSVRLVDYFARRARRSQNRKSTRPHIDADPAAVGELGECLVDRFSGRPDQLCDLFLCQLVGDAQGAVVLDAEALRKLQQQVGDAAGHVGEDQVGQVGRWCGAAGGPGPAAAGRRFRGDQRSNPQGVAVIETARTPVMVVVLEVRGPGSKTDTSPTMSDGPRMQKSPGRSATGCRS